MMANYGVKNNKEIGDSFIDVKEKEVPNKTTKILTEIRLIYVKETFEEVKEKMDYEWLDLIEDLSVYGQVGNERKIRLSRRHIVEVYK